MEVFSFTNSPQISTLLPNDTKSLKNQKQKKHNSFQNMIKQISNFKSYKYCSLSSHTLEWYHFAG